MTGKCAHCGRDAAQDALGDVCAGCSLGDCTCDMLPEFAAEKAIEAVREAVGKTSPDLAPAAAATAVSALAAKGIDRATRLALRAYVKKHRLMPAKDFDETVDEANRDRRHRQHSDSSPPDPSAPGAHLHTPPPWAADQDILKKVVETLRVCMGLVGENRNARLVYLAVTSRLLRKQVSAVVKGLSSSGKSYTIECVVRLFPPEAVYTMTAMSEKALIYLDEPLSHRTIILYEATALREGREKVDDNQTAYIIRSLLSEGQIEYPVVVRHEDGSLKTEKIIVPGPTNLVTSTTSISLHPENETRMISLTSNDSKAQTQRVLISSSDDDEDARGLDDEDEWLAYQRWLASGNREVTIPFAKCVAAQIPPDAVRLRRDWNTVRALIRTHALMHQLNRKTDERGRIVATLDDYQAVRALVDDLVSEGIGATVPESVRQTVGVVASLKAAKPGGVTVAAVAAELKLERTSATRRLHTASARGFVVNLEDQRGKAARYDLGEPMPGETTVLPERGQVCTAECTHVKKLESAGQDCDCGGVCRCAGTAEGSGGEKYEPASADPLSAPIPSAAGAHLHTPPDQHVSAPREPEGKPECAACRTPMKVTRRGQKYHPMCEPGEGRAA